MKRHTARDWTVEEFEDWSAATDRFEAVAKAADEEGGPSLSLVPTIERNEVWPSDLLPPAIDEAGAEAPTGPPVPATAMASANIGNIRAGARRAAEPRGTRRPRARIAFSRAFATARPA